MKPLHLAGPDDLEKLLPLVAGFHADQGFDTDEAHRAAAVEPLVAGSPHGAVWLIGPRKAPVGYLAVSFGWSVEFGGLDAVIDELYVRPAVRHRGMGGEALDALAQALKGTGIRALHLEAETGNPHLSRFYKRAHFRARDGYVLMTRML